MENNFKVYSHTNKVTGVTYIGITKRDPEVRWAKGHGYKNNPYFWKAIVKYGWDNFHHNILYTNLSKEEALGIEHSLITQYKAQNLSYNISDGNDYIGKLRSRPVVAYSKNGLYLNRYPSITEASKAFKLSESGICKRLRGFWSLGKWF